MSLEERAREFVDRKVFTSGCGSKARRLVMEFESGQYAGTGWGKAPIEDKFVKFAAPYEAALRELVEAARQFDDDDSCQYDHHGYCQTHGPGPIPCSMITLKQALSDAERLLNGGGEK